MQEIIKIYQETIGLITSSVFAEIECLLNNDVDSKTIISAIYTSKSVKKPFWAYIRGIIKNNIKQQENSNKPQNYELGGEPW